MADSAVIPADISTTLTPMDLIERAIDRGLDTAQLEKIMDLQERYEKNEAVKKYAEAITGFQSECPMIYKTREVHNSQEKGGGLRYTFAGYDDIKRVTRPLEKKYGITTSFDINEEPGKLHGKIRVRVGNYFEDKSFSVAIAKGQGTNAAQDCGQALSYLKRYLYCAALDIVITGEDDDGNSVYAKINGDGIAQINTLIEQCKTAGKPVDLVKFLALYEIEKVEDLPAARVKDAISALKSKLGVGKK